MTLSEINTYFYEQGGKLFWKITKGPRAKIDTLVGYVNKKGYLEAEVNNKCVKLHRVLYQIYYNIEQLDPKIQIDHINGIKLDNSKLNLRLCNTSQNKMNSTKYITNTSEYKGIYYCKYFDKKRNKLKQSWKVMLRANKRAYQKHFPYTDEGKVKAIDYRNKLIIKIHGDFVNFG